MRSVAEQVCALGDDVRCIEVVSKTPFMPAPLGKQCCESEGCQSGAQHGDLGSDHADGDWLSRIAEAAKLMRCRPHDGGSNCERRGGGEHRPAAVAEPEQKRK